MARILAPLTLLLAAVLCVPADEPAAPTWASPLPMPAGSMPFKAGGYTQSISILTGLDGVSRDRIEPVPRGKLKPEWQVSGGMVGVTGFRSDKYVYLPGPRRSWVAPIQIKNNLGYWQPNKAILRSYPDGTRFDDVLLNTATGKVFEHRSREKVGGKWQSRTPFEDKTQRPAGYTGLTVSCASCHDQAGTGGYAEGLVPGGDTVLSEELDWSVWKGLR